VSLIKVLAWALVGIGGLAVGWQLVQLRAGHSRRPSHAARKPWRDLQIPLVLVADGVIILTAGSGDEVFKWLLIGIMTLLVPVWDLASWARSRASRTSPGPTADPS
jgi:hypothetical protein